MYFYTFYALYCPVLFFAFWVFFFKYNDPQSWCGNLFSLMLNTVFPTGEQKLFLELLLLAYSYTTLYYIFYPLKRFSRFSDPPQSCFNAPLANPSQIAPYVSNPSK